MKAQVLGLSVDSADCLKAWAESLGGISYPLLSDFFPHGQVSQLYGVLRREGYSERSIFIMDTSGVVRYVDVHDIADRPDNEELFRVLAELEPEGAKMVEQQQKLLEKMAWEQARPAEDLVIYCTPWCPDCKQARAWLKEHGIPYKEIDISKDRVSAKRVQAWCDGHETTPTFDYKGTIIVDWDLKKLQEVLGMK
jgi:arsenate reductase-like glutaredoxin family protein